MDIATEIINICKTKGIKIKVVEEAIGVSNGYLKNKCGSKDFPFIKLLKICEFINVPIWHFSEELRKDLLQTIVTELNSN